MNLIFDLVVLLILAFCLWRGHKNGFIKSFFGLFGSILAFIASSILARPIGAFISERFVFPVMEKYLLSALSERIGTAAENLNFGEIPSSCNDILSVFGVNSESLSEMLSSKGASVGESALQAVSELVVLPCSQTIGYAIAYIGLFIVLSIAIRIAVKALDLVAKLPVLNFSNKTLGLIVGALWGVFLAIIFSGALAYLEPMMQGNENEFFKFLDVEKTYLVRFLAKIDLLGIFAIK